MAGAWIDGTDKKVIEKNGRVSDVDCVDKDALIAFRDHYELTAGLFHFIVSKCFDLSNKAIWMAPPISDDKKTFQPVTRLSSSNSLYPTQVEGEYADPAASFRHDFLVFPVNPNSRWGLVLYKTDRQKRDEVKGKDKDVRREAKKGLAKNFIKCSSKDDEINERILKAELAGQKLIDGSLTFPGATWSSFLPKAELDGLFCLVVLARIIELSADRLEGGVATKNLRSKPIAPKFKKAKEPKKPKKPTDTKHKFYKQQLASYEKGIANYDDKMEAWRRQCAADEAAYERTLAEHEEDLRRWHEEKAALQRDPGGITEDHCRVLHEKLLDGCLKTSLTAEINDKICEKKVGTKVDPEKLIVGRNTSVRTHLAGAGQQLESVMVQAPRLRVLLKSRLSDHPIPPGDLIILQGDEKTDDDAPADYAATVQKTGEEQLVADGNFTTKSYVELRNTDHPSLVQRCTPPKAILVGQPGSEKVQITKESVAFENKDLEKCNYNVNLHPWPLGYLPHVFPLTEPIDYSGREVVVHFELAAVYGHYREKCPCCAEARLPYHNIEIWESEVSKEYCNDLSKALDTVDELANDSFMIGVMKVQMGGRTKIYASNSGAVKSRNQRVQAAVEAHLSNFMYVPHRRYVAYEEAPSTSVAKSGIIARNWSGYPIDPVASKKSSKEPGNCVAPKILQQFFVDYAEKPEEIAKMTLLAMTEQWYSGKGTDQRALSIHGKTIPSCATCQLQVPHMLCDTKQGG